MTPARDGATPVGTASATPSARVDRALREELNRRRQRDALAVLLDVDAVFGSRVLRGAEAR